MASSTDRTFAIITFATKVAYDAIKSGDPAPEMLDMGGWQSFKEEFQGNTDAETQLFAHTYVTVCEHFAADLAPVRGPAVEWFG